MDAIPSQSKWGMTPSRVFAAVKAVLFCRRWSQHSSARNSGTSLEWHHPIPLHLGQFRCCQSRWQQHQFWGIVWSVPL